jgi:hypothetical protein
MRLPDPLLVRLYRSGDIDQVTKVIIDDERNVTVELSGSKDPLRFIHLVDVGWVAVEACGPS